MIWPVFFQNAPFIQSVRFAARQTVSIGALSLKCLAVLGISLASVSGFTAAQDLGTPSPTVARVTDLRVGEEAFTVVVFGIDVDSGGLLSRSEQAKESVADSLGQVLTPLKGCEIAFGLIFGGGEGQSAIDTASMIAEVIYLAFPDLSEKATFGRLSLNDPATADHAELTLYFQDGCGPLAEMATPVSGRI